MDMAVEESGSDIVAVLKESYPMETELLGPATLQDVLSGVEHGELTLGRHINLADTIALMSCAASVAQAVIGFYRSPQPAKASSEEADVHKLHEIIDAHLANKEDLKKTIENNPELVERVRKAAKHVREKKGR